MSGSPEIPGARLFLFPVGNRLGPLGEGCSASRFLRHRLKDLHGRLSSCDDNPIHHGKKTGVPNEYHRQGRRGAPAPAQLKTGVQRLEFEGHKECDPGGPDVSSATSRPLAAERSHPFTGRERSDHRAADFTLPLSIEETEEAIRGLLPLRATPCHTPAPWKRRELETRPLGITNND